MPNTLIRALVTCIMVLNNLGFLALPAVQAGFPEDAEVIVLFKALPLSRFRKQASIDQLREYQRRLLNDHQNFLSGLRSIGIHSIPRREYTFLLNGLALSLPSEQINRLVHQPGVQGVFPDAEVKVQVNDSVPLIGVPQVWQQEDDYGRAVTGQGVRVAVIDTGIDYTHPDLGGCLGPGCKVSGGFDFQNNDADPIDDNGHGTHCAGILAADGTLQGVAPGATLLAYKVLSSYGTGSISTIIAGIERAANPDQDLGTDDAVDVISMSLGLPGTPDDPWAMAVDAAVDQGIVVVVAAGNTGPEYLTLDSPGLARKAFSVAATDKSDQIAFFSARGPIPGYEDLFKPEITAPGVAIESTWLNGSYAILNGTSMAAPHVSGAAALLLQMHPTWSPEMVEANLMNTALDVGLNPRTQGAGRLQIDQAVAAPAVVSPGGVSFGLVDTRISTWSSRRTLTVTNISALSALYSIRAESRLSEGVVISTDPASLSLAPGATADITITISIQPALVPPDLDRNTGQIILQTGSFSLTVPFTYTLPSFFEESREFISALQTTYSVALRDLNGDDSLDVFFGNTTYYDHPANTVWFNDNAGGFIDSGQRLGSAFTWDVALGDLDGDGDPDAFVANSDLEYGQPDEVWLNNGQGFFTDSSQRLGSSISRGVALGDLDADGDLDAFVANGANDHGKGEPDRVWLNNGHAVFSDSGQLLGTSASQDVALGDLDGDDDLDAFVACGDPLRLRPESSKIWINNGSGIFSASAQVLESAISQDVALGDLDEDGDLDAFIANGGPGYADGEPDRLWFNNGSGIFTDSDQRLGSLSSYGVVLADIDTDGHLDAFVAGYQGGNKVWLNDGAGHLTDSAPGFAEESAVAAALGDVDDDGDLDAVLANAIGRENRLWLNRGSQPPPFTPVSAPTDLTAAPISQTQIDLAWQDNAADETGYQVERSPDGVTGWVQQAVLPAETESYSNPGLACGASYAYRVRAYRDVDGQFSTYSNTATGQTPECAVDVFLPCIFR